MRSSLILPAIAIFLASIPSHAQEVRISKSQIPAPVLASFTRDYPAAAILGASKETEHGTDMYEIESADGSRRRDILYSRDGKVVEIEEAVEPDSLPKSVAGGIKKHLEGGKLLKSEKVIRGKQIRYEFHVDHKGQVSEIVVDPQGKVVSVEKQKPDKDRKDDDDDDDEDDD
jgi:hypothetical protein